MKFLVAQDGMLFDIQCVWCVPSLSSSPRREKELRVEAVVPCPNNSEQCSGAYVKAYILQGTERGTRYLPVDSLAGQAHTRLPSA